MYRDDMQRWAGIATALLVAAGFAAGPPILVQFHGYRFKDTANCSATWSALLSGDFDWNMAALELSWHLSGNTLHDRPHFRLHARKCLMPYKPALCKFQCVSVL